MDHSYCKYNNEDAFMMNNCTYDSLFDIASNHCFNDGDVCQEMTKRLNEFKEKLAKEMLFKILSSSDEFIKEFYKDSYFSFRGYQYDEEEDGFYKNDISIDERSAS